jgi:hypothetical protein
MVISDEGRRAAAKTRGVKLGGHRGANLTDAVRKASSAMRTAKAKARAADLAPLIAELKTQGVTTLRDIAKALNERGIPTARGKEWAPEQVRRVLAKF